ncbi:GntR family transcriptional regulator [Pararhodonellum marinum]|uniref:GntR family transcriptional regulator n=1 Tax=Pararhodonellum marinum TaxID=2755358 RepID=UPI00188F1AB6|nr:GntR family transcriptional regulator [Pararhodonellum marinum]
MTLEIDHKSPIPLHVQVEGLLRDLIKEPEYQDGKLLPKEVDLAKKLGISRNTIRQATNKLVHENLLDRKKGVGTKVIKQSVSTKLDNWLSFSKEMHQKGMDFNNYRIDVNWVDADEEISNALQIKEKTEVLRLERLKGFDKGPIVYFISYFHPRVGLTGSEDFRGHLYDILEKDYHTVPAVSKEEITAMLANNKLCKLLGLLPGEPVLFRKRLVCDPGDRPIEYNLGYYRADQFKYTIDIKR